MKNSVLKRDFFRRNTLSVAEDILGCFLVRHQNGKTIRAMITEVEAYIGEDDLACHASRGRTPRTETMYGQAGHAYIYLIYGMYHCLNIVTEKEGFPAAVLIRGVSIEGIERKKTNGPGKICKILDITKELNNRDLTCARDIWLEGGIKIIKSEIKRSKRISIDYAKHCREYLWRLYIER